MFGHEFKLSTEGPGIVLYSQNSVICNEGDDYFSKEFNTPQKVAAHIKKGDIIGFNTGSAGNYNVKIGLDYPSMQLMAEYPVAIRLALDVKGGSVNIIDLFWLSEWSHDVPDEQKIDISDGVYHVTVLTKKPDSGIWGDDQDILIFFKNIEEMPELTWSGVPFLFN